MAGSPGSLGSPGNMASRSPGFKNTQTLSELVRLLVRRDADAKERAHAALALQYLSLNVDKVECPCAHALRLPSCRARGARVP